MRLKRRRESAFEAMNKKQRLESEEPEPGTVSSNILFSQCCCGIANRLCSKLWKSGLEKSRVFLNQPTGVLGFGVFGWFSDFLGLLIFCYFININRNLTFQKCVEMLKIKFSLSTRWFTMKNVSLIKKKLGFFAGFWGWVFSCQPCNEDLLY